MDFMTVLFPVSGVETNLLLPPLVAMTLSFFTSMGGVSGAFLLLPFQMSVLNYTAPSVSGTNHVFNIVAIPSGVYRYIKAGRMAWPVTWVVIAGTLPGVFLGYYLRVAYLPDPRSFKFFVGCVLLYIGLRVVKEIIGGAKTPGAKALEKKLKGQKLGLSSGIPDEAVVKTVSFSLKRVEYEFWGELFSFNTLGMFALSLVVGLVGGAYGIGGGAIMAPICVAFFHLPVYTIAGAALAGTFITSFAGGIFFSLMAFLGNPSSMPDWPLGILFGIGGMAGMYLGASFQKYVPQKFIKVMLSAVILFVAARYILQFVI
jgi:uncharacterized membrane protein YfcA